VPGASGQPAVPLFDGKARATYIDFWASWCGPCRQSFPWMNRMQSKFGPKGLRVVAVNLDSQPADAQRFLAQSPAQFTLAFDPSAEAARRFGIKAMPSSVLLGADGKVITTHAGFRDEDIAPLEARIAAALGVS
ncbi:TlpA disulfide reductase family protein, partial [Ideonella sp. DXS29W]